MLADSKIPYQPNTDFGSTTTTNTDFPNYRNYVPILGENGAKQASGEQPKNDPLGIYGRIVSGLDSELASQARLLNYALQSEARLILPKEGVATCLRKRYSSTVDVLYLPEHQASRYMGLCTCKSVWHDTVCGAKISERKCQELSGAICFCNGNGGSVHMITNTFSHKRCDRLPDLLKAFLGAKRKAKQGDVYDRLKKRYGQLGTVSVLESTWSLLHGWHVHTHELVFLGNADVDTDEYEATSKRLWGNATAQYGLKINEHGFHFERTFGAIEDYILKYGRQPVKMPWGTEQEMTKGHLKKGRGPVEHLTPKDMLYQIHMGREELRPIWREYALWFKGHKQLSWSKGLHILLCNGEEEKTDEELVLEVEDDAVLLARLTPDQWRMVLANDVRGELLGVARSGCEEQVWDFLSGIGVPI